MGKEKVENHQPFNMSYYNHWGRKENPMLILFIDIISYKGYKIYFLYKFSS